MNARQRRQYEMLLRVRDFGTTHAQSFSGSTVAQEAFAAVGQAIRDLTATDMMKMAASMSARVGRKAAAREALTDLLLKVTQLAKVLRARGRTTPAFEVPESRSDQALLTAGRQFASDAAAFEAEFAGHGMAPSHIARVTTAFEEARRDRGMSRSDHTAANARIQQLIAAARLDVRTLDLIVGNDLAADEVIQAVWKQARRIVREPRSATPEDASAPQAA